MQKQVSEKVEGSAIRPQGRHRLASDVQVLVGVGGLLALLALAVGLAVILIVSFEDDATVDSSRHVLYSTAIHEAALSAKGIANDQRGYLLSGNPEYLSEIRTRTAEARSAFGQAASYAVGSAQRSAVRESRSGFETWLRVLNGDIAAYRRGERERAVEASLGSTRQLRKQYEQSLANAYVLGVQSIDSATEALHSSASRSVTLLLTYLALALVVGIAVALWVVRAILRPAFTLSQNAIEVLTQGRVLVDEDDRGSHHGVAVVVPIEVVNALAESAIETQEAMHRSHRARRVAAHVRRLYLLRHAKSSWDDPALDDHERPLAPRGRRATVGSRAGFASTRSIPSSWSARVRCGRGRRCQASSPSSTSPRCGSRTSCTPRAPRRCSGGYELCQKRWRTRCWSDTTRAWAASCFCSRSRETYGSGRRRRCRPAHWRRSRRTSRVGPTWCRAELV